ncbi:glycosyltransferase family 4 protein [uncultured Bacteroides sp.]|uniref:glycosyltransferase family 4 protein n=1 Tax=uncultured Bacteroides sp. TaxID=162156 RepID=UPI00280B63E9|nr:glycosyltransferase family 4 protein [uncultured Bacteroides sp.]
MQNVSLNRVGILCYYTFPEGMAPTNRIIAYGKGLRENGIDVDIIIFQPKLKEYNAPMSGTISNVNYHYMHERKAKSPTLKKVFYDRPLALFKTVRYIYKQNKERAFDFVFLSFDALHFMAFFVLSLRILGIRLAFIGDEYPIPIREQLKDKLPWWKICSYKILFWGVKVRILMTKALSDFFNNEISLKPTHILPTITDIDRFNCINLKQRDLEPPYLCYMGNMELAKDNVTNIINAFRLVCDIYPSLELHLYGIPKENDRIVLESLIKELELTHKVFFKGRVDYNVVPVILSQAKILVTSQPMTRRAEGGFPTKLGEYLLSGVPTIATAVGEIAQFVSDGKHVYLVSPCDPRAYADKIIYIMEHYDDALSVACEGRTFVRENFSSKKIACNLKNFLVNNL